MALNRIVDRDGTELKVNKDGSINVKGLSDGNGGNNNGGSGTVTFKDLEVIKSWEGNADETINLSAEGKAISIINDSGEDLFITINNFRIRLRKNESFSERFAPFQKMEVEATGEYRALVRG